MKFFLILLTFFLSSCTSTGGQSVKDDINDVKLITQGMEVDRLYSNAGYDTNYGLAMATAVALKPIIKEATTLPTGEDVFSANPNIFYTSDTDKIADFISKHIPSEPSKSDYIFVKKLDDGVLLKNIKTNKDVKLKIKAIDKHTSQVLYPKSEDGLFYSPLAAILSVLKIVAANDPELNWVKQ